MHSFISLLKRFHSDERGIFAVIFGVMAIVLVAFAGAAVDYTSMETARTRAQIALDSAALGLAPTIYDGPTEDELMADAQAIVDERVNDSSVTIDINDVFVDTANGTLRFTGSVTVPMAFVQLVGIPSLTARITSEATKGSINIEVAVALDNTGSMADYIDDLQEGLDGLIDLVVSDVQEPTYSRMALAPYAAALNGGEWIEELRGTPPAARSITNLTWASTTTINISGATKANPVVITTSTNHGYSTGDGVFINSVSGMTQLNNKHYKITKLSDTTFSLQTLAGANVNGTGYSTYNSSSSDKVRKCLYNTCEVVVNAGSHGFATNDYVRISDTSSGTYNNKTFLITNRTTDAFTLNGITSTSTSASVSTGGNAWCTIYGCEYYYFANDSGGNSTYRITDCVTERMTDTYTEDPPSTTLLGANYTSGTSGNCDIDQAITPLTDDKVVLHAEAAAMTDHGSTAGHIGTAWAWYLLSPDWGDIWGDPYYVPADYDAENLLKVAIIMTDGEYNTQYCNGVSTGTIACDAPDDAFDQASALCQNMKDAGITVYTVGFDVDGSSAEDIMLECASDPSKAFLPSTGAELVEDFAEIGQNITDLRLSL